MEKKNAETLGSLIKQYLHAIGADVKLKEIKTKEKWDEVVGKSIARDTQSIDLQNGILTVKFNSPLIKNEVLSRRSEFIRKINSIMGENIVKIIIVK